MIKTSQILTFTSWKEYHTLKAAYNVNKGKSATKFNTCTSSGYKYFFSYNEPGLENGHRIRNPHFFLA